MHKRVTKDDKRAMGKLPFYMHNVNNRMACSNLLERTIRDTNYKQVDWLDPLTTIANKKSFRRDTEGGSPPPVFDPQKPPKKKMTFN